MGKQLRCELKPEDKAAKKNKHPENNFNLHDEREQFRNISGKRKK